MTEQWLAERFHRERPRLRAVAYRLLGSADDAEDAVQEAWLRLNRADSSELDNVSGWLTTVVAHPDLMLDPDAAAVRMGAPAGANGATAVARIFCGRTLAAQPALVDGSIGMAWIVNGKTRVAWTVYVDGDRIVHIDMHADPDTITALTVEALE